MALTLRAGLIAAALAGTTILAAPASAAPLVAELATSTSFAPSLYNAAADTAQWGCRWGCGWGGGWGRRGWRGGWRRNRIDGGDVLIGAAILGGALAIASSQRRRERDRDVVVIDRDPRYRDRDDRRFDRRDRRRTGSAGLDNAVDMCLDRIERDVRVGTVDNVARTASGWQVTGAIFNGARFDCRIGNSGQIDAIDYDGSLGISSLGAAGGQWDAEAYASARAGVGGTVRPDLAVQETSARGGFTPAPARAAALPAYPGGPIPGEDIPETLEEATGG